MLEWVGAGWVDGWLPGWLVGWLVGWVILRARHSRNRRRCAAGTTWPRFCATYINDESVAIAGQRLATWQVEVDAATASVKVGARKNSKRKAPQASASQAEGRIRASTAIQLYGWDLAASQKRMHGKLWNQATSEWFALRRDRWENESQEFRQVFIELAEMETRSAKRRRLAIKAKQKQGQIEVGWVGLAAGRRANGAQPASGVSRLEIKSGSTDPAGAAGIPLTFSVAFGTCERGCEWATHERPLSGWVGGWLGGWVAGWVRLE